MLISQNVNMGNLELDIGCKLSRAAIYMIDEVLLFARSAYILIYNLSIYILIWFNV